MWRFPYTFLDPFSDPPRWQPMAGSSATPCASSRTSARWSSTASRTWSSRATASSWSTTLGPSPSHASRTLWPWLSERFVDHHMRVPSEFRFSSEGFSPTAPSFPSVCVAARWRPAVHPRTPADGSGRCVSTHDQGHLHGQHDWEQVRTKLHLPLQSALNCVFCCPVHNQGHWNIWGADFFPPLLFLTDLNFSFEAIRTKAARCQSPRSDKNCVWMLWNPGSAGAYCWFSDMFRHMRGNNRVKLSSSSVHGVGTRIPRWFLSGTNSTSEELFIGKDEVCFSLLRLSCGFIS